MPKNNSFANGFDTASSVIEDETTDLYRRHARTLSRYAATLTKDKMIAQDAIQEAFLRYFIARINGLQFENARAWLFRVLRNYIIDCIRKSKSMVLLDAAIDLADSRQNADAELGKHEALEHAFAFLSPRERECALLRMECFSYCEIAQILKIRTGTVGALMARAVKKIHKIRNSVLRNNYYCQFHRKYPNPSASDALSGSYR